MDFLELDIGAGVGAGAGSPAILCGSPPAACFTALEAVASVLKRPLCEWRERRGGAGLDEALKR